MAESAIRWHPEELERYNWRIVPRLVRESDLVQLVRLAAFARAASVLAKTGPKDAVVFENTVNRDFRADHMAGALGLLLCDDFRDGASGTLVGIAQTSIRDRTFYRRVISYRALMGSYVYRRRIGATYGEQRRDGRGTRDRFAMRRAIPGAVVVFAGAELLVAPIGSWRQLTREH